MADYKDYIVRYDIQADVTAAAAGLQSLAQNIEKNLVPLKAFTKYLKSATENAKILKANSKIDFTINLTGFQAELDKMVAMTQTAAAEMQQAIYRGLTASGAGKKSAQRGAVSAFAGRSIKDVKEAIRDIEKEYDKLMGTPTGKNGQRKRDGLIQMAKNANNREMVEERQKRAAFLKELKSDGEKYIKQQEAFEKRVLAGPATSKTKISKIKGGASTNPYFPSVKQIQAYEKAFGGKSKTITFTIKENPKNAATVKAIKTKIAEIPKVELPVGLKIMTDSVALNEQIQKIQSKIKPLRVPVQIENARALKNQISNLSGVTSGVAGTTSKTNKGLVGKSPQSQPKPSSTPQGLWTNPKYFTTEDGRERNDLLKRGYGNLKGPERQRFQTLNQKRIEGFIGRNITPEEFKTLYPHLKAYEDYRKANIGSTGTIAPGKKGYAKYLKAQKMFEGMRAESTVMQSLKVPTTPLLPFYQGPTINATQGTQATGKSSLGVSLNVGLVHSELQKLVNQIRNTVAKMQLSLDPTMARGVLEKFIAEVRAATATMKLNAVNPGSTLPKNGAVATPSGSNQASGNGRGTTGHQASKSVIPSGFVGNGKNRVFFGDQKPPDQLLPAGMRWERTTDLASRLNPAQSSAYTTALKLQQRAMQQSNLANINLAKYQRDVDKAQSNAAKLQNQMQQRPWALASLQEKESKLTNDLAKAKAKIEKQSAKYKSAPTEQNLNNLKAAGQNYANIHRDLLNTQGQIAYWQALPQTVQQAERKVVNAQRRLSAQQQTISRNERVWNEQRNAPSKYTNGWKMVPNAPATPQSQSITKSHTPEAIKRLERMRNNAVAPYVKNASQMKLAAQNLPYFRGAMQSMGLTPNADLWNNSAYLREVQRQMIAANVKVPSYLPSAIAQAERAEGRVTNQAYRGYSKTGNNQSLYDRSRRWAYPFTGNTSFGARTPMAVDMAKGMGVMFAVGGAMSVISGAFSQAMEYQNTMETAKAILQNGTDNFSQSGFENMARTVRNVGIKTKFSAPEVASAAKFLAMAGYDIESINNAIRPIADLALISDSDLGEIADKMTNIMTTFGVNSQRLKEDPNIMRKYGNIMAAVATRSNTDIMMLAESAKYGGGVANMYGREDPNNFADTMAIFGVMGNAGIQGSSAGTALRMMYQNIFNPNAKQKALLKLLEDQYGVQVRYSDGTKRAMSDIILDMANRIPANEQADIVSKLFRITAQPGAMASILAASQVDGSNAEETYRALQSIDNVLNSGGLSALAKLMLAARESVNGDALGAIAANKQNTIQGLWAQVTSTFTEGIVKAFEERKGGFEEILKQLRDYLAKPETVSMIKNLLDMIIEIGKVMAKFVNIWAKLYNFAPGLIQLWVTVQMVFTQIGALVAPIVQLIGVLQRLGISFTGLSISGNAATTSIRRSSIASIGAAAGSSAPFVVGRGKYLWGLGSYNKTVSGGAAMRARQAMINPGTSPVFNTTDALLAGSMLMPSPIVRQGTTAFSPLANETDRKQAVVKHNNQVLNNYASVRARANSIYGWGKVKRNFSTGFRFGLTGLSFASMFGGIKSMFFSLMGSLSKAIGLLVNPITLAVAALAGLSWVSYKVFQINTGATDEQIAAREQLQEATSRGLDIIKQDTQGYEELRNAFAPIIEVGRATANVFDELLEKYDERLAQFREKYDFVLEEPTDGASNPATIELASNYANHLLSSNAALGFSAEQLAMLENGYLTDWGSQTMKVQHTYSDKPVYGDSEGAVALYNLIVDLFSRKDNEKETKEKIIPFLIQEAGASADSTNEKIQELLQQREEFLKQGKSIEDWKKWAQEEAERFANVSGARFIAEGTTQEEFEQRRDYLADYDVYRQGVLKKIEAEIRGDKGTITAYQNSLEQLRSRVLKYGDDKYREAIANVIEFGKFPMQIYDQSQKAYREFEFIIKTLPDGQIDMSNLAQQVADKVKGATITLYKFSDSLGQLYKALATLGAVSLDDIPDMIREDLKNTNIDYDTAKAYFEKHIQGKKNHVLVLAGWDADRFAAAITKNPNKSEEIATGYEDYVMVTGWYRQLIREQLSQDTYKQIRPYIDQVKATQEAAGDTDDGDNNDNNNNNNVSTYTPTNQSDYASHYNSSMIKPTQVNMYWTVNFDHTRIDGSATEKDIAKEIEENVVAVVYEAVAAAANQAQYQGAFG